MLAAAILIIMSTTSGTKYRPSPPTTSVLPTAVGLMAHKMAWIKFSVKSGTWNTLTVLRRPLVPGFWPSYGIVGIKIECIVRRWRAWELRRSWTLTRVEVATELDGDARRSCDGAERWSGPNTCENRKTVDDGLETSTVLPGMKWWINDLVYVSTSSYHRRVGARGVQLFLLRFNCASVLVITEPQNNRLLVNYQVWSKQVTRL